MKSKVVERLLNTMPERIKKEVDERMDEIIKTKEGVGGNRVVNPNFIDSCPDECGDAQMSLDRDKFR
jgi:hypothetical protein